MYKRIRFVNLPDRKQKRQDAGNPVVGIDPKCNCKREKDCKKEPVSPQIPKVKFDEDKQQEGSNQHTECDINKGIRFILRLIRFSCKCRRMCNYLQSSFFINRNLDVFVHGNEADKLGDEKKSNEE